EFIEEVQDRYPDFKVYPDVIEYVTNCKSNTERIKKIDSIFENGINSKYFDNIIKTKLYTYQKEGILKALKAGRVLIADEMGLGKTIQAIAATEVLANHFNVKNVFIIAPTSLKYQWKTEIEKFCGREVCVIEGLIHKRTEQYKSGAFYKILTYGVVRNDIDYINNSNPDLIILDEAQRIKNWKTQTAQSVKKLFSEFTMVLTGTPLENRV
ncbi:unnamed protein product, partial [marine sediment metagenome]